MQPVVMILQSGQQGEAPLSALRLAGALLAADREVRLFLVDDAVGVIGSGNASDELLQQLLEVGLTVRCCGQSLNAHGFSDADLPEGFERSSMKALADWLEDAQSLVF